MKLGILKEILPDERRVIASPTIAARLVKAGWEFLVEAGAGERAGFNDADYQAAGAKLAESKEIWQSCDVTAKIRPPVVTIEGGFEAAEMREGGTLLSFLYPSQNPGVIARLSERKASALAIDCIPRISRAQKLDALSAMANIAGYRAVIEAASRFGSFFTGQITSAGKVPPAQVLVIGAGVAGLAAVATAKSMGAVVRAFDVRASVADQVKSLGAEFLTVALRETGEGQGGYAKTMSEEFIKAEMDLFRMQALDANIVITTALIPGKPAPKLWLKDMVKLMKPGSVIVDLAAENGGNCELTRPGEAYVLEGVTIIGYTDMPSRMSKVASELLANNLWQLLDEMGGASGFKIDLANDIVRGSIVLVEGVRIEPAPPKQEAAPAQTSADASRKVVAANAPEPARETPSISPASPATQAQAHAHGPKHPSPPSRWAGAAMIALGSVSALVWLFLRYSGAETPVAPGTVAFLQHLTVFVMAVFVGWQVIWNVTPALHTPLMSVTNAISGIILIGGLIGSRGHVSLPSVVAMAATLFATINITGGFLVTRRMLAMFRK